MGGLVLLWALAYALVPVVLKSQLEKAVFEKLGRQLTVGAVDFRPWSLELTLSDLVIAKASSPAAPGVGSENSLLSPGAPQLKIARLYIDTEMQSLLRLAPVADAIKVDGLALSLTHLGQGRYDVDDILARLKPPADEPAGNPVRFALYNLVLSDGRLDFADIPGGRTQAVRDLRLSIPFLSNLRSQREVKTSPHLAFKLNGSRFDTAAVGTPFAQTRKTEATLELRGKAEGTASLEILGKLKPLALDITGKVRDLELPPLSPYAVKYSGYGINRGKLSVDVNYVVLPDGRLTASNKLVLNQLSFGDKVEGSNVSLPVKLAVALLADRNGVIDIDLPISGSLNDPQFSLGPVIVKVIFNLIAKAITAPFSLLAGAFGGSAEELGVVGFASGSALLAPEGQARPGWTRWAGRWPTVRRCS